MPGMGGTQRLPRLVGKARAMELCATGKTIAFEEALDMGLVHYIYEKENFMQEVMDYARQFIVPNKSSLAVGKVKRAIQTGLELSLPDGLAFERELLAQTFASEDGQEGVKAYLEKRTAQFKGTITSLYRFPFKRLERFERLERLNYFNSWRLANG